MPDNIMRYDRVLSNRGTEWHGKAIHLPLIDEGAMIDHEVIHEMKRSALVAVVDGEIHRSERDCLFSLKGGKPMLVSEVSRNYSHISPIEIWEMIKYSINPYGMEVVSAGTLEDRKKIFFSLRWEANDKEEDIVNVVSSFDTSTPLTVGACNFRVVCMNTFSWFFGSSGEKHKVYHRGNVASKMIEMGEFLDALVAQKTIVREWLDVMGVMEAEDALMQVAEATGLLTFPLREKSRTKSEHIISVRDEVIRNAQNGPGNSGETLADVFHGVTQTLTSGSVCLRSPYSAQFGGIDKVKSQILRGMVGEFLLNESSEISRASAEASEIIYA
jgi:hypothetical protein